MKYHKLVVGCKMDIQFNSLNPVVFQVIEEL